MPDDLDRALERLNKELGLGATGDFPEGSLGAKDEGGLRLAITATKGHVFVNFGKPTAWFAMGPDQATQFANSILKRAAEAAEQEKEGQK
jgi:hypothetical protein